jgi:hypothetical protein
VQHEPRAVGKIPKPANPIVCTLPPAWFTADAHIDATLADCDDHRDGQRGREGDMKRSPGQWAPWISDPDPSEDPAQPQPPTKPTEQMHEEMINKLFREKVINELLRDHPTLTREKAEEEVDAFL